MPITFEDAVESSTIDETSGRTSSSSEESSDEHQPSNPVCFNLSPDCRNGNKRMLPTPPRPYKRQRGYSTPLCNILAKKITLLEDAVRELTFANAEMRRLVIDKDDIMAKTVIRNTGFIQEHVKFNSNTRNYGTEPKCVVMRQNRPGNVCVNWRETCSMFVARTKRLMQENVNVLHRAYDLTGKAIDPESGMKAVDDALNAVYRYEIKYPDCVVGSPPSIVYKDNTLPLPAPIFAPCISKEEYTGAGMDMIRDLDDVDSYLAPSDDDRWIQRVMSSWK